MIKESGNLSYSERRDEKLAILADKIVHERGRILKSGLIIVDVTLNEIAREAGYTPQAFYNFANPLDYPDFHTTAAGAFIGNYAKDVRIIGDGIALESTKPVPKVEDPEIEKIIDVTIPNLSTDVLQALGAAVSSELQARE